MLRGRKMYAMGNALAIGLRKGLVDAGVPGRLRHRADRPGRRGRPRRRRHASTRDGAERTIRARRGVILGSGGFEKNLEMREKYQPAADLGRLDDRRRSSTPAAASSPASRPAPTTDLMDDAWWGPTIPLPGGPWFCLAERNLPGSIIVNSAGQRFMNEALPYVEAVHEIYEGEATGVSPRAGAGWSSTSATATATCSPGSRRASRSPAAGTSTARSRRPTPLEALAAEIDVPADALRGDRRAVQRLRRRSGVDEDFHRGESAYDKYYSDPTVKPNPSLHSIDQGPFYAVKIVPGDLGTKGGLVTDERARVLRPDGSVDRRACTPPATSPPPSWATPTPAPAPPSGPR